MRRVIAGGEFLIGGHIPHFMRFPKLTEVILVEQIVDGEGGVEACDCAAGLAPGHIGFTNLQQLEMHQLRHCQTTANRLAHDPNRLREFSAALRILVARFDEFVGDVPVVLGEWTMPRMVIEGVMTDNFDDREYFMSPLEIRCMTQGLPVVQDSMYYNRGGGMFGK